MTRSDSGRLIRAMAIFTTNGITASVPSDTNAMAVACRAGRFKRSAKSNPTPRPKEARVRESRPSSGSVSPVFGMDNKIDIAYPILPAAKKGSGNQLLASSVLLYFS
jgi:hypothetical protein